MGIGNSVFSMITTTSIAICRSTFSRGSTYSARLRPCNQDGAAGCIQEVRDIVERFRQAWPAVRIVVRDDSGFCRDELLSRCENQEVPVDYEVGLARNSRLETMLVPWMEQARAILAIIAKPSRAFAELRYRTAIRH